MANKKIVNGEVVDMTASDIAQREADEIAFLADKEAQAQRETDKANARAKLIAGEALTEAEADTIVI